MNSVKNYKVFLSKRNEIKEFIEKWHYSGNINGVSSDFCFSLLDKNKLIGAIIYGCPGMSNIWKKYAEKIEDIIELRRLACIDNTLKNTESYFIGKTLKWLKKNTGIKKVISYSDETYGHTGIIYQATNFRHIGITQPGKVIIYNEKKYHDKAIRAKYRGKLKPFATELITALEKGEAFYQQSKQKHIYLYELK